MDSNITFVIFTYNEEARIERAIKNFLNYGKILIADNKSIDSTCDIARSYGCDVVLRDEDCSYVETVYVANLIYSNITTEWIYWAYADEMLDKFTLDKILEIISINKYEIINISRKNYYYGKFIYNVGIARANKIFKKNAIDFTNNPIHSFGRPVVLKEKIYYLSEKYFVHHFISNTASSYLRVHDRYSDAEAQYSVDTKLPLLYSTYFYIKIFVEYFFKGGYRAGYAAIAFIQSSFIYRLLKYMKRFEKANNISANYIEELNNDAREKILKQF